jgi:hypothetical protein
LYTLMCIKSCKDVILTFYPGRCMLRIDSSRRSAFSLAQLKTSSGLSLPSNMGVLATMITLGEAIL